MGFRLDPRDARDDPAPAPAPVVPAAPAPAPRPAPKVVAPPPAVRAPSKRKLQRPVLIAVVVGALLLAGGIAMGTMYALDVGPFAYPERYLLTEGEAAQIGMKNAPLDPGATEEFGILANPGKVPEERLNDPRFGSMLGVKPEEMWIQGLTIGSKAEPVVAIFAMQLASVDDANKLAGVARRACSADEGRSLYQDGDVLVMTMGEGPDGLSYASKVGQALVKKNSDLVKVC